ncbi:hypothetical protein [Archangium violaceum]|uniref:Uncharacterized protein n=1 Tax=Archangium violaceum Cb vi76 TaxID=1406225 RepID=A0A084T0V3_9BACT|nr:hypothetical protein [Archangium violaceum]KFA94338.1 hypothetical protein Q664_03325 [Archangium violaceum Cb vi76]
MSPSVHFLEWVNHEARFGVRFRDAALGHYVSDGLVVSVWHESRPGLRQRAQVNHSNVWVVGALPGQRELSPTRPFWVEVQDTLGRFLPCSFQVELPSQKLLTLGCLPDTPLSPMRPPEPAIPLFSAPARQADSTLAVLRADLWDTSRDSAAAWARLDVMNMKGLLLVRGMADDKGRAALFFNYPNILKDAALHELSWPLRLEAYYAPPPKPVPRVPELCAALNQPRAWFKPDTSSAKAHLELTLHYGQPLVVRTQQDPLSRLRLTPANP